MVAVAGLIDYGLSSRHSLLNSIAYFCTVDKAGESSSNVVTISALMSLEGG